MTTEAVYVGVDVARNSLDVAVSSSEEVRQFANNHEDITNAVQYIAGVKPAGIILEATGHLEMPLAAALQAYRLCPQAVFIEGSFASSFRLHALVFGILARRR